jgi:hypothetical protein
VKAVPLLNDEPGHFDGYLPEHAPKLRTTRTLRTAATDDFAALETVFQVCNGADPQSDVNWYVYGYRSLSVGDVVQLADDDGSNPRAYACARYGWDALPGFLYTTTVL